MTAPSAVSTDWRNLIPVAALGGVFIGVLAFFVFAGLAALIGFDFRTSLGVTGDQLLWLFGLAPAILNVIYTIWFERRIEISAKRRWQEILALEDLRVETHQVADLKFVREPEHGQCMFFVLTKEGKIIFVFEGQDELEDAWEERPLVVQDVLRPRKHLKIIRHPKTKECVLADFDGDEIPLSKYYQIGLTPQYWPASGKVLKPDWNTIDRRYQLKVLTANVSQTG